MLIFGIETSCDETACAIVEDGRKVIANNVEFHNFIYYTQSIPDK